MTEYYTWTVGFQDRQRRLLKDINRGDQGERVHDPLSAVSWVPCTGGDRHWRRKKHGSTSFDPVILRRGVRDLIRSLLPEKGASSIVCSGCAWI